MNFNRDLAKQMYSDYQKEGNYEVVSTRVVVTVLPLIGLKAFAIWAAVTSDMSPVMMFVTGYTSYGMLNASAGPFNIERHGLRFHKNPFVSILKKALICTFYVMVAAYFEQGSVFASMEPLALIALIGVAKLISTAYTTERRIWPIEDD